MSKRKNELLEIPEVREEYFSLCSHPIVDVHKLAEFFKRTIDERYTERQYCEPHKKILDGMLYKHDNAYMTKDLTNMKYHRDNIINFFNNVEFK